MKYSAEKFNPTTRRSPDYELPLSERMRTFLRIEFLYQQYNYFMNIDTDWSSRSSINCLLEMMSILSRGDIRSDAHKELDRHIGILTSYHSQPAVDAKILETKVTELSDRRDNLRSAGTNFMQPLRDNEFLSAIRHRSTIPGGTCEFDLPEFGHWLRQDHDRRNQDLQIWLSMIEPVCNAVIELLWLIRESTEPTEKSAVNGMYQHKMPPYSHDQLVRVKMEEGSHLFPEISGNQHRFTVRFLEWCDINQRAIQTHDDVLFNISIC
jgi:cell division protein ZapD